MGHKLTVLPGGVDSVRVATAMVLSLGVHAGAALWVDGWARETVDVPAARSVQVRLVNAEARETLPALAPQHTLIAAAAPLLSGADVTPQTLASVRPRAIAAADPMPARSAAADATPVTARPARRAEPPARAAVTAVAKAPAPDATPRAVPQPQPRAATPALPVAVAPDPVPAAHARPAIDAGSARAAVDAPPRAVAGNAPPQYPSAARRLGQEGQVLLRLQVLADGTTSAPAVVRSSGVASLDRAARLAVSRWRFTPASSGGRAVAATVEVPVVFRLDGRG